MATDLQPRHLTLLRSLSPRAVIMSVGDDLVDLLMAGCVYQATNGWRFLKKAKRWSIGLP